MKLEITQLGVFDAEGAEIAVGTIISVDGDEAPGWLVGKSTVIGAKSDAAEMIVAATTPTKK